MKICMVLAILRRCMKIEKFSAGKRWMWIRISGQRIDDLQTLGSGIVTGSGGWCARQRWCWVSASGGWRCTCSLASPACLWILRVAILARKASGCVVSTKHSRVSCCRSLHLFMPRRVDTPLLLFLDHGARLPDQISCFPDCRGQKSIFGHLGHIEGQEYGGLFQLYPTSFPCHSSRHIEYLQESSCCFEQWDSAITSTIYAAIASPKEIQACFVHSRGCLS